MKKILFILILIIISIFVYVNVNAQVLIPDSAIRVRVIPNSNSVFDQNIKDKVKTYVNNYMNTKLNGVTKIDDARNIIDNNIEQLNEGINDIFKDNDYNMNFTIKFGDNYFPYKVYKGVVYNEGNYESLVVYIGEAKGDNWWCVLFPPLCLLEADESDNDEVEYRSFVKDVLDKIF